MLLDGLRNKLNVTWKWVEGHGTTEGNIEADRLAGIGVSESSCYWQNRATSYDLKAVSVPTKSNEPNEKPAETRTTDTPKEDVKPLCSFCNQDTPGKKIPCSECKSMCHYSCTRLPRYQLYALQNTHRKYSCEKCLKIPDSFATEIEDEVSLRTRMTLPSEKLVPETENSKFSYVNECISKNNSLMRDMLQTFQTNTVHALETAFVDAIEKLGRTNVTSKENDQQSQIKHLLQEKDRLLKEKENLIKSVKSPRKDSVSSPSNQQKNTMEIDIQRLTKERDDLQMTLHTTTTELEVSRSKLQTETSIWRQKLDAMSSRNDILSNESLRLEKLLLLKNEDIVELENCKRDLKKQVDILESEVLSWKLHESRADDTLLQQGNSGSLESSVVLVEDGSVATEKDSYSTILTSKPSKDKNINTQPAIQRPTPSQNTEGSNGRVNDNNRTNTNEQSNINTDNQRKDKVIMIGTSNVRYLNSRFIAGKSYYVHKEIKYTVGEAKSYIESLSGNDHISKFVLHLSCNDIKSVSAEEHATSYCNLVQRIHDKFPETQVIVSLGLPRKDKLLSNKIDVSNGLIKEKLFSAEKTIICDNSNLAFRGTPVFGVLEDDGVHITRKGVFILNNNFRCCLYGSSNGTVAVKPTEYRYGHRPVQRNGMVYRQRQVTGQRRFGNNNSFRH